METCSDCIFYEKCEEYGIVDVMNEQPCKNYEDYDFFVEINEYGKSGYHWVEMSYARYTDTTWDLEPDDWEKFIDE